MLPLKVGSLDAFREFGHVEKQQSKQHDDCMRKFIALANELKAGGVPVQVVSWSLMSASGVYATYSVAGNDGGLSESGIEKVTDAYKKNLVKIQAAKAAQRGGQPANE